jgi:hypothetical protein
MYIYRYELGGGGFRYGIRGYRFREVDGFRG